MACEFFQRGFRAERSSGSNRGSLEARAANVVFVPHRAVCAYGPMRFWSGVLGSADESLASGHRDAGRER